ncbi:hypothetical protein CDAR_382941 [Caerostris darwini]|uniref:Uncharacterized protein n=1 Tax=Caerostris darwini TaxID=1538125 RepID=A0AAV4SU26_9ARAC|nr:hypothetical protein CDAR_382941 [Caerostris darwini]
MIRAIDPPFLPKDYLVKDCHAASTAISMRVAAALMSVFEAWTCPGVSRSTTIKPRPFDQSSQANFTVTFFEECCQLHQIRRRHQRHVPAPSHRKPCACGRSAE